MKKGATYIVKRPKLEYGGPVSSFKVFREVQDSETMHEVVEGVKLLNERDGVYEYSLIKCLENPHTLMRARVKAVGQKLHSGIID